MARRRWRLLVIVLASILALPSAAGPAFSQPSPAHSLTSITGRLISKVSDDFDGHRSEKRSWVETSHGLVRVPERLVGDSRAGETVRLTVSAPPAATTQSQVASAVRQGSAQIVSVTSISAAASVTGLRKVIMIPAYIGPTAPTTPTTAGFQDAVQRANDYWSDASSGAISLSMERVAPWTRLPDSTDCESIIGDGVEALVRQVAGPGAADGHHAIMLYMGGGFSCGWDGYAYIPGDMLWLVGTLDTNVIAHELGHNYGLNHSGTLRCYTDSDQTDVAVYTPWCSQSVYEDYYDVMGNGSGYPSSSHLADLGLLPSSEEMRIVTSGTVTLKPVGSKQGLRLIRANDGPHELLIEYRTPVGLDSYIGTRPAGEPGDGVVVRELINGNEYAIDGDPLTSAWQPALLPGMSLTTPIAGGKIEVLGADTSGATVRVSLPVDTTAPTILLEDPGNQDSPVFIRWTVADGQSGVASQAILVDGRASGLTVQPTATSASVPLAAGSHTIQVTATDKAGNTGTSDLVSIQVAGPPSVAQVTAAIRAATVSRKSVPVTVSWTVNSYWDLLAQQLTRSPSLKSRLGATSRAYATKAAASAKGVTNTWKLSAQDDAGAVGTGRSAPQRFVVKTSVSTAGFSKGWKNKRSKSYLGRSERRTSKAGAAWSGKLTGRAIALVASKGKGRGVIDVYVDGVLVASPDLFNRTTQNRQVVFSTSWSTAAAHVVKVACEATPGRPRCDLDGYVLIR